MAVASPDERGLVVAVFQRGRTCEEAGVALGVAHTTVMRRRNRLFARFRECGL